MPRLIRCGSAVITLLLLSFSLPTQAEGYPFETADSHLMQVKLETADGLIAIERVPSNGGFIADTTQFCPPLSMQPIKVAEGVETVGELELIDFMVQKRGLLIDARTEELHLREAIPGSVNIPYTLMVSRLDELGCSKSNKEWNCAAAERVALYCTGMQCGQSAIAIRAMLSEGYPAEKILYYRGGLQSWKMQGLSTVEGSF